MTTAVGGVDTLPGLAEGVLLDLLTVVTLGVLVMLLWRGARGRWPVAPAALATALWAAPVFSRSISGHVRCARVPGPCSSCRAPLVAAARVVRAAVVLAAGMLTVVLLRRLTYGMFAA
ncbi:hypothetical protein [Blastococcus deserti]|uniref:Uncharacterized protein n=1 Tax=Blastococcus deserti TaxID=2259033 RepID=A0ABW4XE41_9ACTN